MAKQLTVRQQQILDFIAKTQTISGYPPSIQEIASHFGFRSLTTVVDHLKALERKGSISRSTGARTITLHAPDGKSPVNSPVSQNGILLPLIGKVAAGTPILAVENIDDYFLMDKRLVRYGDTYMLQVTGDSMINAHIMDGDLVLVRPQSSADSLDIVVAIINNEATVKRYVHDNDNIILKPEHPHMQPLVFPRKNNDVRIVGVVVGIFRRF